LASPPSDGAASTSVTAWPACARRCATVMPSMPPPTTHERRAVLTLPDARSCRIELLDGAGLDRVPAPARTAGRLVVVGCGAVRETPYRLAATAHDRDRARGIADRQVERRHVVGHHRAHADECPPPD